MARPLRIEFAGALYHLTSRGNGRADIYLNDTDKVLFLAVFTQVCQRFNWVCHSYCLMSNHYHLLVETPESNLSQGMRHLNGVYTQKFNRSHKRVGHLFQGRYKAILVQKEAYLLELSRYIVLNPVRAKMVRFAKDWPWSSYRATAGLEDCPAWLKVDCLLAGFAKRKSLAMTKYQTFVVEGRGGSSPWQQLKNQIYLGSETFVDDVQCKMAEDINLSEVPSSQKRQVAKPLNYYESLPLGRNDCICRAYLSGGYSMVQIANHFGLHYSSVSKIVNRGFC